MAKKLDQNFLQSLLRQKISSFKFAQGSKKGDNVAGALTSISIETESGENLTLIVKLIPADDPVAISYLVNFRTMEVESEFYGHILEDLRSLSTAKGLPLQLPFPKCYGHSDIFLALEDLRPAGYRMADKYVGLNGQEASLVLSRLASFHALTYILLREQEGLFLQNQPVRELMLQFPWNLTPIGDGFLKTIDMLIISVAVMAEHNADYANKLEKLLPEFYTLFQGIWAKTDTDYFPVLCHGDFWLNNFLFKYNSENEPTDVKFIDMQQVHRGNIFEDLNYFFLTSTTPSFRAEHLKSSLQSYADSFVETLQLAKCPVPAGFSLDFVLKNYLANLKSMAVFVGGAIAFQLGGMPLGEVQSGSSSEEVVEGAAIPATKSADIILRRYRKEELIPASKLNDDLGLYCETNLRAEPRALKRFVEVIEEFDNLGVFN